jgi:hypothetical protein
MTKRVQYANVQNDTQKVWAEDKIYPCIKRLPVSLNEYKVSERNIALLEDLNISAVKIDYKRTPSECVLCKTKCIKHLHGVSS